MSSLAETKQKIIEIIETLRIYINQDGGDLEFLDYIDGYVHIRIMGACVGCALIDSTYHDGLESILKNEVPEIKGVIIDTK